MSGLNIKWVPSLYKEASVIAQEATEELLSRLDWMTVQPQVIVDMGCGTGEMSQHLQKRYPEATLIALDTSELMLHHAQEQVPGLSCIQADATQLPLPAQSVDLMVANLLIPWCAELELLLKEWRRVLRPNGLLMLTAFGPDTLKEWKFLLSKEISCHATEMHDLGDLMLKVGLADPVLDINYYTLTYSTLEKLYHELYASGMLFSDTLSIQENEMALSSDAKWEVTYEVVFAHAFMPALEEQKSASEDGIVRIPLSHLRQQLHSKES